MGIFYKNVCKLAVDREGAGFKWTFFGGGVTFIYIYIYIYIYIMLTIKSFRNVHV